VQVEEQPDPARRSRHRGHRRQRLKKPPRAGTHIVDGVTVSEEHGVKEATFSALGEPFVETDVSQLLDGRLRPPPSGTVVATTQEERIEVELARG
jgi:hypothetical protein